ncbi:MAG: transglycosylase SLT domain-containing protein [Duganella sp.]
MLTTTDTKSEIVKVDDSSRLREIRALVEANNQSSIGTDVIICQIYMESRFDKDAHAQGSSARGLMQLLKAPIRELARLKNLEKTRKERRPEAELYREADAFHDSPELGDEAINIRTGTAYLQALITKNSAAGASSPVAEAYKDYRGLRNGIYYDKIKAAAEKLSANPDSMEVLREMVK